jgi:hypothetical protein
MPAPDRAPQTTRPYAGKVAIVTGAGCANWAAAGWSTPACATPAGSVWGPSRRAVGLPRQAGVLRYHWNGTRIDRVFDYRTETWTEFAWQVAEERTSSKTR